jgi:hypothetical protein
LAGLQTGSQGSCSQNREVLVQSQLIQLFGLLEVLLVFVNCLGFAGLEQWNVISWFMTSTFASFSVVLGKWQTELVMRD